VHKVISPTVIWSERIKLRCRVRHSKSREDTYELDRWPKDNTTCVAYAMTTEKSSLVVRRLKILHFRQCYCLQPFIKKFFPNVSVKQKLNSRDCNSVLDKPGGTDLLIMPFVITGEVLRSPYQSILSFFDICSLLTAVRLLSTSNAI
jgi:hypothetical protein